MNLLKENLVRGIIITCAILLSTGCKTTNGDATLLGIFDYSKNIKFLEAVKAGNLNGVNKSLRANVNVNTSDRLDQTALMWACWNGELQIIDRLLDSRNINTTLSSKKYLQLDYNALFCYVMSNNITSTGSFMPASSENIGSEFYNDLIETLDSRQGELNSNKLLYRLIDKNQKILTMTDSFGENVIHKITRSHNAPYFYTILAAQNKQDYRELQRLAKKMKNYEKNAVKNSTAMKNTRDKIDKINIRINRKKNELLEKENKIEERQRPLHLAIQTRNRQMVRLLLENKVEMVDPANGDTLLELAFNKGQGDYGVFMELLAEKHRRKDGLDTKFEESIRKSEKESKDELGKKLAGRFRIKYEEYKNFLKDPSANASDLLIDKKYDESKNKLVSLLKKRTSISKTDIAEIDKILRDYRHFAYDDEKLNSHTGSADTMENKGEKSILELAIETGKFQAFQTVYFYIESNELNSASKNSDYFTVALVNDNIEVMNEIRTMYKSRGSIDPSLWGAARNYQGEPKFYDSSSGSPIIDPLHIFLKKNVGKPFDHTAQEIIDFYKPRFNNNSTYLEGILKRYLDMDISEEAFKYIFDRYKTDFGAISNINGDPLIDELLKQSVDIGKRRNEFLLYYLKDTQAIQPKDYPRVQAFVSRLDEKEPYVQEIRTILEQKTAALSPAFPSRAAAANKPKTASSTQTPAKPVP